MGLWAEIRKLIKKKIEKKDLRKTKNLNITAHRSKKHTTLSYSLFERHIMKTAKSIRIKNGGQSGEKIRLFPVPQKEWRASQVGKNAKQNGREKPVPGRPKNNNST